MYNIYIYIYIYIYRPYVVPEVAYGGFLSLRHNIRDITACLLNEECHNVALEPSLMPLSRERLRCKTANTEDGARLDIRAQGFWSE